MSTPEVSLDPVDYREGIFVYTQRQPGVPTMTEITLMNGVARRESDFFKWIIDVIEGRSDYREDIEIWHFHHVDEFGIDGSPSRRYRLFEAFPIRMKSTTDMDATASDIALQELDMSYEHFEIAQG